MQIGHRILQIEVKATLLFRDVNDYKEQGWPLNLIHDGKSLEDQNLNLSQYW